MKKTYKNLQMFITLLCLISFKVGAQALSGTVTIDQGSPASPTNFQSFTALAAQINTAGITGALDVFVVANSGPYIEQPAFNNVAGTSASTRLKIHGNGNTLSFNSTNSGQPYTLLLNGTKFMAVDNLNIVGLGTTYAMACVLTSQANYNTFTTCSFSVPVNGTSSYQIPFTFNSSTGLPATGGDPGNFNTITTSTLSGGYYSIFHYGLSSSPWTRNNTFDRCVITDWYYYCVYAYYAKNLTIKGCDFSRPTRTTFTTVYFYYGYYNQGMFFDSNVMHDFWTTTLSATGTMYMFYYCGYYPGGTITDPSTQANRNTISNNIIRDMKWLGTTYTFYYNYYAFNDYIHNTFSYDYTAGTGSTYVFYYCYNVSGGNHTFKNNNFSLTKGGTNYCYYTGGNPWGQTNYNNFYTSGAGNWVAYTTSNLNFAQWQSASGQEANSYSLNPNYVNLSTGDLHPTNVGFDNAATPLGVIYDNSGAVRNTSAPDIGALEFNTPLCTGAPAVSGLAGANYLLCPGQSANLSVGGNLGGLSPSGITYQWQTSSISGVGPWTPISGANGLTFATPSTYSLTYYSLALTCTNAGGAVSTPVATLNIAGTTTSLAPYFESFETIAINDRLPNCSWYSPSLGGIARSNTVTASGNRIPNTGSSYAYFDNGGAAASTYYYTNGINLTAGITYSISAYYRTDLTGATNWSDFSFWLGTSQSTTGLVQLASTNGPAVSPVYALLSNTFVVSSTGLYYVGVRGVSSGAGAQFLTWDDLKINTPCNVAANQPSVTITTNQGQICTGSNAILTAGGANSYTWSTGATTSTISVSPSGNQAYNVTGTSTLTTCQNVATKNITVNVAPSVIAVASAPAVCAGQPCNLSAYVSGGGAATFAWSNGNGGSNITVNPTTPTAYTVVASSPNGCSSKASLNVGVNALPVISIGVSNTVVCMNTDVLNLVATPQNLNYLWYSTSSSGLLAGSSVNTNINTIGLTTFTAVGTDAKGCTSSTITNISVNACTGLKESNLSNQVRIFPNPSAGVFTVEFATANNNSVEVVDVTGRLINKSSSNTEKVEINISNMATGVYYVKASNDNISNVYKIVKE